MPDEPGTFVKLPHAVMERRDLSYAAKVVYAAIADRIGDNGTAWPGLRRLAEDCGSNRVTVAAAVKQLQVMGLLFVKKSQGGSNTYRLKNRTPTGKETGHPLAKKPDGGAKKPYGGVKKRDVTRPNNQTHEPEEEVGGAVLSKIDLDRKARTWSGISNQDRAFWRETYPACDLDHELRAMIDWCLANPAKGRKSNYRRFIANWLKRQQDKGGSSTARRPAGTVDPDAVRRGIEEAERFMGRTR